MRAAHITELLAQLGCAKVRASATGVRATCPLAPYTHAGGRDRNPSFGVKVSEEEASSFSCFSCGASGGDLKELLWALEAKSGADMSSLLRFVWTKETGVQPAESEKPKRRLTYERPAPVDLGGVRVTAEEARRILRLPTVEAVEEAAKDVELVSDEEAEFWKHPVPRGVRDWALEYLDKRRLTLDVAHEWGLGMAPAVPYKDKDGNVRWMKGWRLVFPVRDCKGRLVGWSARLLDRKCRCRALTLYGDFVQACTKCRRETSGACDEHGDKHVSRVCPACWREKPPKFFHRQGFKRNLFLFGEDRRVREERRGVLVEGPTDVMGLRRIGYNVFGLMGGSLSVVQVRKLCQWLDEAVVLCDGDDAGKKSNEDAAAVLRAEGVRVSVALPPEGVDPGEMSDDDVVTLVGYRPQVALDERRAVVYG